VLCAVSREYSGSHHEGYWFAFHPHQKEFLESSRSGHVAFGCGSPDQLLLFPYVEFAKWLEDFNRTELEERFYWHVRINKKAGRLWLLLGAGRDNLDVTEYLLGKTAG